MGAVYARGKDGVLEPVRGIHVFVEEGEKDRSEEEQDETDF